MDRVANGRNTVVRCFWVAAFLLVATPVWAQGPGVRAGVSVNPDQLYVGAHYETAALVESLHFKPNVEVGFGDDVTAVTANFEFVWKFPPQNDWTLFVGGGPALNHYAFDESSATEAGFNVLVGAEFSRGLAFEVKIGAIDSPDIKFGVGYTFR